MIPLRAENPRRRLAVINGLLITANILVFLYQLSLPPRASFALVNNFGVVPARVGQVLTGTGGNLELALKPLATSMFLHGGLLHLLGNILFLWVFGGNVEGRLGRARYLVFYLLCGVGAGVVHILVNWGSPIPAVGASGAISGVMGAYIMLFPYSRILTLVPLLFFFFTVRLPAVLLLGYWFVIQFLSGLGRLGNASEGGVAWWAHVGGFLLGVLLVRTLRS